MSTYLSAFRVLRGFQHSVPGEHADLVRAWEPLLFS